MFDDQGLFAFPEEQFRAVKLQVMNWGTFSGVHQIDIAERGFLFVGSSGSGKSTLLDAFSQLLVPTKSIDFNAAAHEASAKGRGERSAMSYVRGAWTMDAEGAVEYLRKKAVLSALALTLKNQQGRTVTLVQLLWIAGSSTANADLQRRFMVLRYDFDLARDLDAFGADLNVRRFKKNLGEGGFFFDNFAGYEAKFLQELGINSKKAMLLLHKTQSAKNLGDLNDFVRRFMLDTPETIATAEALADEFTELEKSYKAVVRAEEQIAALTPAEKNYLTLLEGETTLRRLEFEDEHLTAYGEKLHIDLQTKEVERWGTAVVRRESELARLDTEKNDADRSVRDLERLEREKGGEQIETWEREKKRAEEDRDRTMTERGKASAAVDALGWAFPATVEAFDEAREAADALIEKCEADHEARENEKRTLVIAVDKAKTQLKELRAVIRSLEERKSGIPLPQLTLREKLATLLGMNEADLPFAGELIQVKEKEGAWRGAIERALHAIALTVLVPGDRFEKAEELAASQHWGEKLRLMRDRRRAVESSESPREGSLLWKIDVTESPFTDGLMQWLETEADFLCAETAEEFRREKCAVLKSGLLKTGHGRLEKDDRFRPDDPRGWVLGSDVEKKLEALTKECVALERELDKENLRLKTLTDEERQANAKRDQAKHFLAFDWIRIDPTPFVIKIAKLDKDIRRLRDGSDDLKKIAERLEAERKRLADLSKRYIDVASEVKVAEKSRDNARSALAALHQRFDAKIAAIPSVLLPQLSLRIAEEKRTLDSIVNEIYSAGRALTAEIGALKDKMSECRQTIEKVFVAFLAKNPDMKSRLTDSVESAPEFIEYLDGLRRDRLPEFRGHFRKLLREQSAQQLTRLLDQLKTEKAKIRDGLERVNESLKRVPYNIDTNGRKTFLVIKPEDRHLPDAQDFRQLLLAAAKNLANSLSEAEEDDRFALLSTIVSKIRDKGPEAQAALRRALDVREHLDFKGEEVNEHGAFVDVASTSGKSGGQRQKLTTTCLAAALRYQLCGDSDDLPTFAPVVLDEAFDKADSSFTTLSMKIFEAFGFQMIVATPDKAVSTLEPFIGGACVVHIVNRNASSLIAVPYDDERQRLNWTTSREEGARQVQEETGVESVVEA